MTMAFYNCSSKQFHRISNGGNPPNDLKECFLQHLYPTGTRFDKFVAQGLFHNEQMSKWTWRCRSRPFDRTWEKIRAAVSQIGYVCTIHVAVTIRFRSGCEINFSSNINYGGNALIKGVLGHHKISWLGYAIRRAPILVWPNMGKVGDNRRW